MSAASRMVKQAFLPSYSCNEVSDVKSELDGFNDAGIAA